MRGIITKRRSFFKGVAAALAATPLVPLRSQAADEPYPKRLIFFFTPNGTVMDAWWPSADFQLGPILSPLAAFKDRMVVMRGVDMESAYVEPRPKDHWPDFMNHLTARQGIINPDETSKIGGISIDQHIAAGLGGVTPYPSLHLGVRCNASQARVSALGANQPIAPQNNPSAAFDALFSDLDLDPLGLAKLRAERRSVLDTVMDEVSAIEAQTSGTDREKLQAHLAALQGLEGIIEGGGGGASCAAPVLDAVDEGSDEDVPDIATQQFRIAQMALACDLTRVMTLQISQSASRLTHPWLGIDNPHHGISHGSEGVMANEEQRTQWLIEIETWYAERFGELLGLLDSIDEGGPGQSMLDHSLVVWAHEQQSGASHNRRDMPYVLAGGLHGTVETGRRVDAGGVPHNGLLIALANLMDVPTTEFGDPAFSNGALPELWG
jgi:hypothetical protein